jgi:hypothetical protein
MTMKHLKSNDIDLIALSLSEDVYGASGDFKESDIKPRLIEHIHRETDYHYATTGMMPVSVVADLIRSIWEFMDRKHNSEVLDLIEKKAQPRSWP